MTSKWSYAVIHTDIDTNVTTDLSDDVLGVPVYTDTGSGELNVAHIKLHAPNGKYITLAPIIDQFDKIRITGVDEFGYTYDLLYDVKHVMPPENKNEGSIIELDLVDTAQHLNRMYYVGPRYFTNAYEMFKQIGKYYNENKGSKQPTLKGHDLTTYNKLPNYTVNTYDFGLNQEKCLNRMIQVADKLGGSVESGGVLDYFDVKFESAPGNITDLYVKAFSSGEPGSFIIRSDSTNDIVSTEPEFSDIDGNVVYAWGGDTDGSLPVDFSQYKSKQQLFPLHPLWRNDVPYQTGSKIQFEGVHYERTGGTVSPPGTEPPSSGWTAIDEASEYGDIIDYSPWTRDKKLEWKSSFARPDGSIGVVGGQSAWDGNLVVFEEDVAQRTWVDFVIPDGGGFNDIPIYGLFANVIPYRGMRVLLLGFGSGVFAGDINSRDNFGNYMPQQVLEYGDVGDPLGAMGWFVKFPTLTVTDQVTLNPKDNAMVGVVQKGTSSKQAAKVYKFISGTWTDISSQQNGNDCFHPYQSIDNADGIPNNRFGTISSDKNFQSAVEATYVYNPNGAGMQAGVPIITPDLDNKDYYSCGAWLNFRFPFPISRLPSGNDYELGYLFGGDNGGSDFNMEPVTLDAENMNYLPDGTRGFNQTMSESYGNLSTISFFMKILYQREIPFVGQWYTLTEANFKVRCFLFDTDDNVVFQDFTVSFNDKWEEFHLPLSGFQIYRGRRPKEFSDVIVPAKQLDAQNIFIWRNIKQMCFQLQESYDAEGRFEPHFGRYMKPQNATDILLQPQFAPTFPENNRKLVMSIDAFRFTKPLLVGSGVVSDRDVEVDFLERRTIGNYYQLQGDVLAELEKSQHRKTTFEITTPGEYSIKFGDTFYYINPRLVTFSDSGANTVKLVAKKIEYSITKGATGQPGGFTRKITGVRRFE